MAIAARLGVTDAAAPRYLNAAAPYPFEELLVPFVEAARAELARQAGAALDVFSAAARTTLERALLQFLSHLALPTLETEFALWRALEGSYPWPAAAPSTAAYDRFVAAMRDGGMARTLREYPILDRVVAAWTAGWARSHARLARRLARDWPEIRERFGLGAEGRVVAIAPYRSDPHRGGEAVAILEFAGGRLLVAKPRALTMEVELDELLAWTNARGFPAPFRRVAMLTREDYFEDYFEDHGEDYGWMEHVAAAPCATRAEVAAFYTRAGGLLCLLSLLQATDLHHENLIAAGAHPVVVDVETLFHPRAAAGGLESAIAATGFLPAGDPDFSAFGATGAVATPFPSARCDAVNSDAVAVTREPYRAPRRDNVPTLHGRQETASAHAGSIAHGFAAMYRLVIRHRGELLARLGRLAGRRARVIARSSNVYGLLLQRSMQPDFMRDAARRAALFAGLSRDEIDALERLDVPYLDAACDEPFGGSPPALAVVMSRVERAAAADLSSHLQFLRSELAKLGPGVPIPIAEGERNG